MPQCCFVAFTCAEGHHGGDVGVEATAASDCLSFVPSTKSPTPLSSPSLSYRTGKSINALSRPAVVKQFRVNIKSLKLQDPNDKRNIVADDKLEKVLGAKVVAMSSMNRYLKFFLGIYGGIVCSVC